MDFIKLLPTPSISGGLILNRIDSAVWIERYREAGEFHITTDRSSGLLEELPTGSFITHKDTLDVMEVDVHSIAGNVVTISGRGITTVFDRRIVGSSLAYASPDAVPGDYILAAATIPDQWMLMLRQHCKAAYGAPADDELASTLFSRGPTAIDGESVERIIDRKTVYEAAIELLALYDHGWSARRSLINNSITFSITGGNDKTSTVNFSEESGELLNAEYLRSTRANKNVAFIQGRFVHTFYYAPSSTGWSRRTLFVDASDIDEKLTAAPVGAELAAIKVKMQNRGRLALMQNNNMNIVRADISSNTRYRYRTDYTVGDFVSVEGMLGASSIRRVTEYTEIEDSNGTSGYPTLSTLEV